MRLAMAAAKKATPREWRHRPSILMLTAEDVTKLLKKKADSARLRISLKPAITTAIVTVAMRLEKPYLAELTSLRIRETIPGSRERA